MTTTTEFSFTGTEFAAVFDACNIWAGADSFEEFERCGGFAEGGEREGFRFDN